VSTQWAEILRESTPGFAASDIMGGNPVTIATGSDWLYQTIATTSQEPVGIVRRGADAAQGKAVTVFDGIGNVIRVIAGATVLQRQDVNISGATSFAHPVSGLTATQAFYGPVSGASGSVIHRVGIALEQANPGQQFALRVNPKQLSGLS
jgi:hypothetical protein